MRTEHWSSVILSILLLASLITPLISITVTSVGTVKAATSHVVISEFATRGPNGVYDEFVELYNPTDQDINIQGWKLEYALTTWAARATIGPADNKIIPSHGFYLLANPAGYAGAVTPDKWWDDNTGFSDENRSIRIVDSLGNVVDMVGYGPTAYYYEGSPGPAHLTSQKSVERKPGYLDQLGGNGTDTDNNAADFVIRDTREPQNSSSPREPATYAVSVSASPEGKIGSRGSTLTYTITIKNLGTENDNYDLAVSDDENWGPTLDENRFENVPPGEDRQATLSVTIPDNAVSYTIDKITVTATSENASDSAEIFAATHGVWITASHSPIIKNYAVAVVGAGENIYVANSSNTTPPDNYFMRYNTASGEWTYLSIPPQWFKNGTCLAWDNGNYIYALLGGSYGDVGAGARHYFFRYNISDDSWQQLANTTDPGGQGAGDAIAWVPGSVLGVPNDNFIYAIIGSDTHGSCFRRYSISSNTWENVQFHPGWGDNTDDGCSLVWTGGENLYALRGEYAETTPCRDFARFKLTENTWENLAPIPDENGVGDGGSLLWIGDSYGDYIYALGGGSCWEDPGRKFYCYKISTGKWVELADLPAGITDQNGPRLGFAGGNIYCWRGCFGDPVLWTYGPIEVSWDEVRLPPIADAQVVEAYPTSNYGGTTYMYIGSSTTAYGNERSFLKFDLSTIPENMSITGAELWLYCFRLNGASGKNVQCRGVENDDWNENTITWNDQPAYENVLDTSAVGEGYLRYSWNVAPFVANEYAGDKVASFCMRAEVENLTSPDNFSYGFDTKEWTQVWEHPYLRVTYTSMRGVSVSISPGYQSGTPGETLYYMVTVANTGIENDNYILTVFDDENWGLMLLDNLLEVPAGENRNVTLSVIIPEDEEYCTEDLITVKATSKMDETVSAENACIAHQGYFIKENMPDLGQHCTNWCWTAAAANSIKWYAHHGYPELLDAPENPGLDNWYVENWFPCPDPRCPEHRYSRLLHEIAVDCLYPGYEPENELTPENTWCHPVNDNQFYHGLREFIQEQGAPLYVHEILNPDNFPAGSVPENDGENVIYDNVTFDDYKKELERCQDVLLQLAFMNYDYESGTLEGLGHIVTGVSFFDGGPGNRWIEVSDPWTPLPGPDHNNLENLYENRYDNLPVVNEDPLIVTYTGMTPGGPITVDVQVIKLIYISPTIVPENFTLNLVAGWNLIGFPLKSENTTPDNMFAGVSYTMYYWVAPGGPYRRPFGNQPVEDNLGYWVKLDQDKTLTVYGVRPDNRTIYFIAGWNLVHFPLTSADTTPDNMFAGMTYTMYYWVAPGGPYRRPFGDRPVELSVGYWVKVTQDKTVTVPL